MDVDALPAESRKLVPAGPILKGGKKDLLEERSARHLLSGTPFEFMLRGMRTVEGARVESKSFETPAKASGPQAESLRKVGSMNSRNPLRKQHGMFGSMLSCVCMAWLGFCMSLFFRGFFMKSLDRGLVLRSPESFAWTSACSVEDPFRFSTTWAAWFRPKEIGLDRQEYALAVVPSAREQEICAAARRTSTFTITAGIVSPRGRGCSGLSSTTRPQKGRMQIIKIGSCYNPNEGERLVFGARAAGRWKNLTLIAFSFAWFGFVLRRVGRAEKSQKKPEFSGTQGAKKALKNLLGMGFVISVAVFLLLSNSATLSRFCDGSSFAAAPHGKLSPCWGGRCGDECPGLPGIRRSGPGDYHRVPFFCPNPDSSCALPSFADGGGFRRSVGNLESPNTCEGLCSIGGSGVGGSGATCAKKGPLGGVPRAGDRSCWKWGHLQCGPLGKDASEPEDPVLPELPRGSPKGPKR